MKIEIDQNAIDRLMKKRVTEFNKTIRDLTAKLARRDKKIQKLAHELEVVKGDMMETERGVSARIAQIAHALITEMQSANWIKIHHDCEEPDVCVCGDFY